MRTLVEEKTKSINGLSEFESLVGALSSKFGTKALLLLDGPLGVGKTQFVRFLVENLGGRYVSSPSFAIHQRYPLKKGADAIDHVDLYRLKDENDLESTGFWDLFAQENGIVIVEWAGKIAFDTWPVNWPLFQIELEFEGDSSSSARRISLREFR